MSVTTCPFCGLATSARHETPEQCVAALHLEIALTRDMVNRAKGPPRERPSNTAEPRIRNPR